MSKRNENLGRGQKTPTPKWYKSMWTWLAGALAAALTAALVTIATGLFDMGRDALDGPPLTVQATRLKDCPFSYAVPGDVGSVPDPASIDGPAWEAWAANLGGVDAGTTDVEVIVTGESEQPVILRGLEVDVLSRDYPQDGFIASAVCGDAVAVRYMDVDLDQDPPVITATVDNRDVAGGDQAEEPVTFPYSVSSTKAEVFHIYANTSACDCTWRARLLWAAGDESGEIVIEDDGKPFNTHGTSGLRQYYFQADGTWYEVPA